MVLGTLFDIGNLILIQVLRFVPSLDMSISIILLVKNNHPEHSQSTFAVFLSSPTL
jgi:hypothetical protein